MNITIKATRYNLDPETERVVTEKLSPIARLLGADAAEALLAIELEEAPPEGRSSEPSRLAATVSVGGKVFHAEAVKPTAASAADRVRSELESEIRRSRGRTRALLERGNRMIKGMLHWG